METKRLQFTRDHIIALVRDPQFFVDCPDFSHLAEAAVPAVAAYDESERQGCCGGNFGLIRGMVDAVFVQLQQLTQSNPEGVQQFRDYLAKKKGYVPNPVVVYYRRGREGKIGKLTV